MKNEIVVKVFVFVIAGILAVISIRSFRNHGFLLNNEYFFASKEEREKMDKKPYYRQTAIVFLLLSIVFLIIGVSIIVQDSRVNLLEIPFIAGTVIYAIVSTMRINSTR